MKPALRELFAAPLLRVSVTASACGVAAYSFVENVINGLVTTPFAFSANSDLLFAIVPVISFDTAANAVVAGRAVNWVGPLSGTITLVLVLGATAALLRLSR